MHQEKDEHEGALHSANAAAVLVPFDERDLIYSMNRFLTEHLYIGCQIQ